MKHISHILKKPLAAVAALIVAATTGCMRDTAEGPTGPDIQNPAGNTSLLITVPGMKTPTTRAMDAAKEMEVQEADIIVFDDSTTPSTIAEHFRVNDIAESGVAAYDYIVKVGNLQSSSGITVAVVANASFEVADALAAVSSGGTFVGASKKGFLEALEYAHTMKWLTGSSNYMAIPMYGEITPTGSIYDKPSHPVELVRMVAKVDVVNRAAPIDTANPGANTFELTAVHLVNQNTIARLAPMWDANGKIITQTEPFLPNLPANAGTRAWSDGRELTYTPGSGQTGLEGEIYLMESMAGYDASEDPSAPNTGVHSGVRLIMEGNWTDADGNTAPYYYPVDFTYERDGGETRYMPVLRNYRYVVTITAAEGHGYDRMSDAVGAYSVSSNLKTRVISYDESEIRDMLFDGQYLLGIDQKSVTATRETQDVTFKLFADNPGGWKASIDDPLANDWLRFAGDATSINGTATDTDLTLTLAAFAPGSSDPQSRQATIKLSAGRLSLSLTVTQTADSKYYIRIMDMSGNEITELNFNSKNSLIGVEPDPQKFIIQWIPADEPLTILSTPGTTPFTWQDASTNSLTDIPAGGFYVFNVDPTAIEQADVDGDPFVSKSTSLSFSVDNTDRTAEIVLRQTHYDLLTAGLNDGYGYVTKTATIKANAAWTATVVQTPTILAANNIISGSADTTGRNYTYTFNSMEGIAVYTFSSQTAELFDDVEVTITGGSIARLFARSNIVMYIDGNGNKILTFAEVEADNTTAKPLTYYDEVSDAEVTGTVPAIPANALGLHFRWGGLVGLSSNCIATNKTTFTSNDVVFWPKEYEAAGKKPATWTHGNLATGTASMVPYGDDTIFPFTSIDYNHDAFAAKYPTGTVGYDAADGLGDICRYISAQGWVEGEWRMPKSSEYRALKDETTVNKAFGSTGTGYTAVTNTATQYGYTQIPNASILGSGVTSGDAANPHLTSPGEKRVIIPAAGYRFFGGGDLYYTGYLGYNWSSTPSSISQGYGLNLTNSNYANSRGYGLSIRCIRN